MTPHSAHYPTFIEHPKDPAKRALVQTPWLHHKQLLGWGLEGLTPEPAPPAGDPSNKPVHDPVYPKWIENPKTGSRKLVAKASDEAAQWEAWGIDPDDEEDDDELSHANVDRTITVTKGYAGPTPLAEIETTARSNAGMAVGSTTVKPPAAAPKPQTRDQRRAEAKKQREADAARNRQ